MGDIGQRLREARETQHITLRGAAKRLRISEKYLAALEEDRYEELPQGAYVLGFLRNYGLLLGIGYKELKDAYLLHHHSPERINETLSPAESRRHGIHFVMTAGKLIGFVILVASLTLLWYLFKEYRSLNAAPQLLVYLPHDSDVYRVKTVVIEGHTDPSAYLSINGSSVNLSSQGDFEQDYSAVKNGPVQLEIVAKNRISGTTTKVTRMVTIDLPSSEVVVVPPAGQATTGAATTTSTPPAATRTTALEMVLRVTDKVWFGITTDSSSEQDFILDKGQTRVLQATDKITVHSGKAYATYVSLNGGPEVVMGDTSVVIRTWTKADIAP